MSSRPRLIVVDDSKFTHKVLQTQLDKTGVEIVGNAMNGAEAVELYDKLHPDIVLLDCIMPVMDGPSAIAELMKREPRPVIIVLSSLGCEENVVKCLQLGARTFVQKPFDRTALVTAFRALGFACEGEN